MRIILSNKFFYPRGGDCIHTIQLKQLLESKGHKVAIFTMQHNENIKNEYSSYWPSHVDFSSKNINNLKDALLRPISSNEVKRNWKQLLANFKPDIIHLHNVHSQLSPVLAQIAKQKKIPVVWTLHDYKLICPAYTLLDSEGNVCEACFKDPRSVIKKKCIKNSLLGSTLGYLEAKVWTRSKLENYTNTFISPSGFLRTKMVEAGFKEDQIAHVYNFADDEKFNNVVKLKRENQVVYVGRISHEKGVETICKAFQNKKGIQLKIIGDGPLREALEEKYAGPSIKFLGYLDWEAIKEELSKAKFLIIPSEWYENNPLTIIESLALGTPVLGAKIGGIPELIEKHVNGITFTPGDQNDLSRNIDKMLEFDDWQYQLIQTQAKSKFSQEHYYKQLMKIYSSSTNSTS